MPASWMNWIFGVVVTALGWVVRGYALDVKKLKATHMTRSEVEEAITQSADDTAKLIAAHQAATAQNFADLREAGSARQTETVANFRELRVRLDQLNDTLLKVALK